MTQKFLMALATIVFERSPKLAVYRSTVILLISVGSAALGSAVDPFFQEVCE